VRGGFHQEDNRKIMNKNTKPAISIALTVAITSNAYAQNLTNNTAIETMEVVG